MKIFSKSSFLFGILLLSTALPSLASDIHGCEEVPLGTSPSSFKIWPDEVTSDCETPFPSYDQRRDNWLSLDWDSGKGTSTLYAEDKNQYYKVVIFKNRIYLNYNQYTSYTVKVDGKDLMDSFSTEDDAKFAAFDFIWPK